MGIFVLIDIYKKNTTMKKIKITEKQYDKLLSLIVETPFDTLIKNSTLKDDVIKIDWGGNINTFKVIDSHSGQIIMDNIDKGSANINYRYLIVYTSLNKNILELKRIHKIKEVNLMNDFSKWKNINIKNITGIEIYRDGTLVDEMDPIDNSSDEYTDDNDKNNNGIPDDFEDECDSNLGIIMEQLDEGKALKLIFNRGEIILCCNKKTGSFFDLEITKNEVDKALDKWDSFSLIIKPNDNGSLYDTNTDIVNSSDGGITMSIKFDVFSGHEKSQIWIKDIVGVSINKSCDKDIEIGDDDENKKAISDELDGKSEDQIRDEAKEIYNEILSDKTLRDAFYKQPSFWETFVGELKGEKAPGTGIITVMDIVKRYTNNSIDEEIGYGFSHKKGDIVKFIPITPISIPYNTKKGGRRFFEIGTVNETEIRITEDRLEVGLVLQSNLPNDGEFSLRVVVFSDTDKEDVKECRLTVGRVLKSNNKYNILSESIVANLKFIKSEGYNPEEVE